MLIAGSKLSFYVLWILGDGRGNARKSIGAGRGALTSSAVVGTQERRVIRQPVPATLDYNQLFGNPYVREPIK